MRKRKRLVLGMAALVASAVGAVALTAPTASADVPGPFFATSNLGSDPHIIGCTDPSTGTNGYCLYTSQDMGQLFAYKPANHYPMRDTKVYFSPNGFSNWVAKGTVFSEWRLSNWVPQRNNCATSGNTNRAAGPDIAPNCGAYHLWAPSAVFDQGKYWLFVPDVSNTSHTGTVNIHNSSRIAVASSTSPFGPFDYHGTADHSSGYMSDPDAVFDSTNNARLLFWADGDNSTCGGFKSALMNTDWRTPIAGTTKQVAINGIEVLGDCDGSGPLNRPYMEGASVYKRLSSSSGLPLWTMVFAAKPMHVPPECATWDHDDENEVIAWASATTAQGPYTYQGIMMCGSESEWTNQATLTTVVANGVAKKIIIYHDSAEGVKERRLHAECLYFGSGHIAGVYRQPLTAAGGFNDCMAAGAGGTHVYKAMWGQDPQFPTKAPLMHVENGTGDVIAKRHAVGPWERFSIETLSNGRVMIRAMSNGKLLCSIGPTVAIKPGCTSSASIGAQFIRETTGSWNHFRLKSPSSNKYVSIAGNGRLYLSADDVSTAATFAMLSPTGG